MKAPRLSSYATILLFIIILSCRLPTDTAETDGENGICEELSASNYIPTSLSEILCVARDAEGTLYVIDKENYSQRCFISSADTLRRQKVMGGSILNERYFFLSLEDGKQLLFQNDGGIWSDAYLCRTGKCDKCDSIFHSAIDPHSKSVDDFAIGWQRLCAYLDTNRSLNCPALVIAQKTDLNSYTVRNFSATTHVEYLARRPDGNYLLVTRAEYDWNGDIVLHYGEPRKLEMRTTTSFLRANDGGSTWIRFKIGSTEAEAFFGVEWDSIGTHEGKTWMAIQNDTVAIERVTPETETLTELGIECDHAIR